MKLNQFKQQIRSKEVKEDEEHWMNNKLKFSVDSERAYGLQKVYNQASANSQINKLQEGQKVGRETENKEAGKEEKRPDIDLEEVMKHVKD